MFLPVYLFGELFSVYQPRQLISTTQRFLQKSSQPSSGARYIVSRRNYAIEIERHRNLFNKDSGFQTRTAFTYPIITGNREGSSRHLKANSGGE